MKKTYKFELPQNKELKSANTRVEDGKLFVDVEFQEKFDPKDGDFIFYEGCNSYAVFICKRVEKENTLGCFCGIHYFSDKTKVIKYYGSENYTRLYGARFATKDEEEKFLTYLKKECGKHWNAETKKLEDIRWRAKECKKYYYVDMYGGVCCRIDNRDEYGNSLYNTSNYFRTPEAAQKVVDQIKEIFKNSKAE